jgi:DNA-binding SARP family transcriptional activator
MGTASIASANASPVETIGAGGSPVRLRLLDGFGLEVGGAPVELPPGAQRLLALLALRPQPVTRAFVAGTLWLDAPEPRAAASLRSVLWRLSALRAMVLESRHGRLSLNPVVEVDLREAAAQADRWMSGRPTAADLASGTRALEAELLPDWYEDWVVAERERFRQLRLHALEAVVERMIERGRSGDALLAALAAVLADPLRESAHRALISVHLAEGNLGEAIRQLRRYERLLAEELGIAPSGRLAALIGQQPGASPLPVGGDRHHHETP